MLARRFGMTAVVALLVGFTINVGSVFAQQLPVNRVFAVFPPGGQKGTTFDVAITNGVDLEETHKLVFSHPGITAAPKLDAAMQPQSGQFAVTVAADVPPGVYDLRAIGMYGLSNPRCFVVGDRKEIAEVEPNNDLKTATPVEINTVINARSNSGTDLDYFKFAGKSGQRVLADARALRIDSRMDVSLELYNAAGRKLATAHANLKRDALLDFTLPADGDYFVKVFDFVYGGSNDHFYRLSLHIGPHIDFIVPASGIAGTTAEYTIYGRNLPGGQPSAFKTAGKSLDQLKVQIALPADGTLQQAADPASPAEGGDDGISYTLASPAGASSPVTVFFASGPVAVEAEPNDKPAQSQKIAVPTELTGQFQARGDIDYFTFDAKAGDVFWIEALGERTGSGTDPHFAVEQVTKNDKGEESVNRITAQDDNAANIGGNLFNTSSDDPVFKFTAGTDGTFRVVLRDRFFESRGDPRFVYRLSIRKESPDFRLAVLAPFPTADQNQISNPYMLNLRKGDNLQVNVMAYRRDGYTGPIEITVEGLPAGVTCPGAILGTNQDVASLTFTSTDQAAEWAGAVRIIGKAKIDDAAAVKALADAEAAHKAAVAAQPPLDKAAADTAAAAKTAAENAAKAKEALDKDANNENFKNAKKTADEASAKADAAAKTAAEAKAAGDQKVAAALAAVTAAQMARQQKARDVARDARPATIVWQGGNINGQIQPAVARIARTLMLSIQKEAAYLQLVAEGPAKFEVNQGRQILIPVKLLKRAGFDNNVNLTFVAPPQNVQVENKPINKGADSAVYRVFVQNNTAPGTYTLLLQGAGQISYSRNAEATAKAAAEKVVTDKAAADATEADKKAKEAVAASTKKMTDTAAAAKTATDAKVAADKLATDTAAAAKAAADAKVVTDKAATDTDAAAKSAAEEKVKADKAATDADAAAKTATEKAVKAKADSDGNANDKALADAKVAAEKAAAEATEAAKKAAEAKVASDKKAADTATAAKTAADAKAAGDKKATDAADATKKAADAKVIADKAATDTAAAAKTAVDEKAAADKAAADAAAKLTAANAAKAAADKKATDTANVSKPANVNVVVPATTLTLVVKQGPGTMAVAAANGGAIKRGANIEVKVTVTRANGFTGPVTLSLPLPPGVAGLTAPEVTVPADKNEGTLVITAAAEATEGQLANMVVRAKMDFNGPAEIDQPIALNVQK
jgi:hypothetical protein